MGLAKGNSGEVEILKNRTNKKQNELEEIGEDGETAENDKVAEDTENLRDM